MVDRPKKPAPIQSPVTKSPQPVVDISPDNSRVIARLPRGDSVEVLFYGATVISWKSSNGAENLWLSEAAKLDGSKPVRGGIPVVFPVFGPPPSSGHATSSLPQHGFARNSRWEFLDKSTTENDEGDSSVKLDFGLYSSALTPEFRKAWPYDFSLIYSVTLGGDGLQTMLSVRNEGEEPFDFQVLLHTYLRVKDISQTTVNGLGSSTYIDKVLDASEQQQTSSSVKFEGEVDRVYKSVKQNTTSVLEGGKPRFDIVRDNLADVVTWNPWITKAKAMGDFEPKDGYKKMVCVEAGAIDGWQKVDGGDVWEGGQTIKSTL